MHRVTDSYGPIPLFEAGEQRDGLCGSTIRREAVYTKMFEELDEAIEILGRNTTLPAEAWSRYDGVYYGNIAQWLKYANSLKLRMAMRLSYVKSDVARAKAAAAIAGGVIEANADNAAMHAAENRTTLIYNDWERPPCRSRHPLLHERLQRPAYGEDVPCERCRRLCGYPYRHRCDEQVAGRVEVFEYDRCERYAPTYGSMPPRQRSCVRNMNCAGARKKRHGHSTKQP